MPDATMLIDLAAPRFIVFRDRGLTFTYTLAPISSGQWRKYFDGIVSTAETIDKNVVNHYDNNTASAELVRSAVTNVGGYSTATGDEFTSLDDWKQMLPLAHLLTVAGNLRSVERAGTLDVFTIGSETVALAAIWGVSSDGAAMTRLSNLVHRFNPPTIEHQRRYDRDRNRSIIVGGSRTGKTKWLGAQNALMQIYDELIVSVDGYTVSGSMLTDADAIRLRMDGYHKVAAAEGLFVTGTIDEPEVAA